MNTFPLPVIEIDHQFPASSIISSQWLDAQIEAAVELQRADHLSLQIINSARRKAEKIVRDSYREQCQRRANLEEEIILLRENILEQMEAEWLEKHVRHLLDDENMQRHCVRQVADHILNCIERVLTTWFDGQTYDQTLCHRLAKQAQAMAEEEGLVLRVNPAKLELMETTFGKRFRLVADANFAPDRAELSSAQLSVEFSLNCHFRQLLAWIRQTE